MAYRPGPIPKNPADLAGFLDRELNRIAQANLDTIDTQRVRFGSGPTISTGTGTPESFITAPVGSLYLRLDGGATTTLYVKTSGTGNTGWTPK